VIPGVVQGRGPNDDDLQKNIAQEMELEPNGNEDDQQNY
jgi:hypothetical protein